MFCWTSTFVFPRRETGTAQEPKADNGFKSRRGIRKINHLLVPVTENYALIGTGGRASPSLCWEVGMEERTYHPERHESNECEGEQRKAKVDEESDDRSTRIDQKRKQAPHAREH
jgi:hypothetical protein